MKDRYTFFHDVSTFRSQIVARFVVSVDVGSEKYYHESFYRFIGGEFTALANMLTHVHAKISKGTLPACNNAL